MRHCCATEHENSRALCMVLRLLGDSGAGVRASLSSDLIFGVGGGFQREKQFRLVTSAATVMATIPELIMQSNTVRLVGMNSSFVVRTWFDVVQGVPKTAPPLQPPVSPA